MNTTTYNIGDIVEDDRGNTGEIVGIAGDRVEWQDIPAGSVAIDTGPRGYWIVPIKHLSSIDQDMIL